MLLNREKRAHRCREGFITTDSSFLFRMLVAFSCHVISLLFLSWCPGRCWSVPSMGSGLASDLEGRLIPPSPSSQVVIYSISKGSAGPWAKLWTCGLAGRLEYLEGSVVVAVRSLEGPPAACVCLAGAGLEMPNPKTGISTVRGLNR